MEEQLNEMGIENNLSNLSIDELCELLEFVCRSNKIKNEIN